MGNLMTKWSKHLLDMVVHLEGRKEGNILFNQHSTHFIYGYMASDMW